MTGPNNPPRWAETLLVRFLRIRDRETIAGDLLEEYREAILSGASCLRADCWYIAQALSIVSTRIFTVRHLLLATCLLSILAAAQLAYISPATEARPLAIVFAAQSILTIAMLIKPRRLVRLILPIGALAVASGGILALMELVLTHFDVKLAYMSAAFVSQGVLTIALLLGVSGGFKSERVP
jgi:hypothetical protein